MKKEIIGPCTLYLGDCLEILPIIEGGGGNFAVVTDPPYGTDEDGGGYGRARRRIKNDGDLEVFGQALKRFPCRHAYALVFYAPKKTQEFTRLLGEVPMAGEVVWNKKQMGLGYIVRYAHENIALLKYGDPKPRHPLESVIACHSLEKDHPHQKPVELMEKLVAWQGKGAIDPFMGSGSTGVACARLGQPFVGIEIDPQWFDLACRRVEAELRKPTIFKNSGDACQTDLNL